jgi:structural maintenance of chromosome 1
VETLKAKVKRQKKEKEMYEAKIQEKEQDAKAAEKKLKDMEEKAKEVEKKLKTALDQKQEIIGSREEVKKEQDEIEVTYKQYQVVHKEKSEARDEVVRKIEQAEKSVEQAKDDYKALLNQSKLEDLELPRRDGSKKKKAGGDDEMEEDEEEGGGDEDMQDSQEGESQGQSQVDLARQEVKKLNLDYAKLPRDHKKEMSEKDQEQKRKEFRETQSAISDRLQGMNPNMKAAEQLKEIEERFSSLSNEWMEARKECDELSEEFERVKKLRCDKFNKCFEHVTGCIDDMYKELTIDPTSGGSVGGSAYLTLNSQDEPYTSGIKYDTIPPGKRFMDMVNLSGGEKTVAALALIFAINSYNPAPFIVLDEVDAALDAQNVAKVTRFIQARREEQQCVIISLKERFYEKADGLVGICKSAASGHSNAFTLDLQLYDDQVATA